MLRTVCILSVTTILEIATASSTRDFADVDQTRNARFTSGLDPFVLLLALIDHTGVRANLLEWQGDGSRKPMHG